MDVNRLKLSLPQLAQSLLSLAADKKNPLGEKMNPFGVTEGARGYSGSSYYGGRADPGVFDEGAAIGRYVRQSEQGGVPNMMVERARIAAQKAYPQDRVNDFISSKVWRNEDTGRLRAWVDLKRSEGLSDDSILYTLSRYHQMRNSD